MKPLGQHRSDYLQLKNQPVASESQSDGTNQTWEIAHKCQNKCNRRTHHNWFNQGSLDTLHGASKCYWLASRDTLRWEILHWRTGGNISEGLLMWSKQVTLGFPLPLLLFSPSALLSAFPPNQVMCTATNTCVRQTDYVLQHIRQDDTCCHGEPGWEESSILQHGEKKKKKSWECWEFKLFNSSRKLSSSARR